MSFSDLKKSSSLGNLTAKLIKEVEKQEKAGGKGIDDLLWKPEMGKDGVGSAIIRFLPAPNGEDLPWAKIWTHYFKGPGGYYVENCPTTHRGECPVCNYNRGLWNTGQKGQDIVSNQKRKLSYYSNIYVVKDPANPQNEGHVFLYKYGKIIHDMIVDALKPKFEDQDPINPFHFWQGANFHIRIKMKDKYWDYGNSSFGTPGPLLDDDDAMEALWKKANPLAEIVAPEKFKPYEELDQRLKYVLAETSTRKAPVVEETEYDNYSTHETKQISEEQVMEKLEQSYQASKETTTNVVDEEEDPLAYFAKLQDS